MSRFRQTHVLAGSWLMFGLGVALTGVADHAWQYVLAAVIWTLGEIGSGRFGAALVADLAPTGQHGRYQAMFSWAWAAAELAGPLLGSALYGLTPAALWWSCLAVEAAAALTVMLVAPALRLRG